MNETYTGVGVALATPFDEKLEVDYAGLKNLLEHTALGADYYVAHGTTGESVTTTGEEKAKILEFIKNNNPKNLPIVVGIGGNNTADVIAKIKKTDFDGIGAVLSVSPYYNKPSQEGIYQHYVKIADAAPVPVILYNVPGRTSSNISAETTLRLAEHENIIGTKDASCNIHQTGLIAKYKPEGFSLISGDDMFALSLVSMGGQGVISVLANAFPEIFKNLIHSALKGGFDKARAELFKVVDINPLMYVESSPVGVKQLLEVLNICKKHVRLPLVPASEALKVKITEKLHLVQGAAIAR